MNENTITISLDEYKELLNKAERIAIVERLSASNYISDDIRAVLGISVKKEGE